MEKKKIGTGNSTAARRNDQGFVETMKPFVHFGVKAMAVIGSALVTIVRNIPKPEAEKPKASKDRRIIKI
ncbi:hypothetical protein A0256_21500 [Mucilaginibacter sp. PAMC 26640]|nr:hypothetical protein A0256_21500 [Mucilaginibacter sp. PAMC 26640]